MVVTNWNRVAFETAWRIHETPPESLRGAVPWHKPGICLVYGDDDYSRPRTRYEVDLLIGGLNDLEAEILGFGVAPRRGRAWAMFVDWPLDPQWLDTMVWRAFRVARVWAGEATWPERVAAWINW